MPGRSTSEFKTLAVIEEPNRKNAGLQVPVVNPACSCELKEAMFEGAENSVYAKDPQDLSKPGSLVQFLTWVADNHLFNTCKRSRNLFHSNANMQKMESRRQHRNQDSRQRHRQRQRQRHRTKPFAYKCNFG
jgi:hypothetical protein